MQRQECKSTRKTELNFTDYGDVNSDEVIQSVHVLSSGNVIVVGQNDIAIVNGQLQVQINDAGVVIVNILGIHRLSAVAW